TAEAIRPAAEAVPHAALRPMPFSSLEKAETVLPPQRVWSRGAGTGTGLRENDTVRDLYGMRTVRESLDTLGEKAFGSRAWAGMRDQVMDGFRRERLMAGLRQM